MNLTCFHNIFLRSHYEISTYNTSFRQRCAACTCKTYRHTTAFYFAPKPANQAWHCVFAFWLCVRLSYLRLSLWLADHSDTAPAARSCDWPKQTSKMCSKCCLKWKTLYVIKAHILQRVYFILCVENHHRCCVCSLIKCKYCLLLATQLCLTPLSKRQPRVKPAK